MESHDAEFSGHGHTPPLLRAAQQGEPVTDDTLLAACTPNSAPDAEGHVEHGFQINVLDSRMTVLATIQLPDWETFRPASAGHRLIEHGYMIRPDARDYPEAVNGWRRAGMGMMTRVVRIDDTGQPTYHDRVSGPPRRSYGPDVAGVQPGAVDPSGERPGFASRICPPGYVWLGDFAGYEVGIMRRHEHAGGDTLCLHHRCGWAEPLAPCGTQDDHSVYLGNIVERVLEVVEGHTCQPYEPSPEHQARVARWESTTDVSLDDVAPEQPEGNQ